MPTALAMGEPGAAPTGIAPPRARAPLARGGLSPPGAPAAGGTRSLTPAVCSWAVVRRCSPTAGGWRHGLLLVHRLRAPRGRPRVRPLGHGGGHRARHPPRAHRGAADPAEGTRPAPRARAHARSRARPAAWRVSHLRLCAVVLRVQAIGIVGDAGVRASAQQAKLYVGMVLILIFAEALGLYGLIVGLILTSKTAPCS